MPVTCAGLGADPPTPASARSIDSTKPPAAKTRLLYEDEEAENHALTALAGSLLVELDRIGHHRAREKSGPRVDQPVQAHERIHEHVAPSGKKMGSVQTTAFKPSAKRHSSVLPKRFAAIVHSGVQRIPVTEPMGYSVPMRAALRCMTSVM